jgi:hypothetical protein
MNYRDAPQPRPLSIVRYRPSTTLGLAPIAFGLAMGFVGMLALAAMFLRHVVIRCDRAQNLCRIESHWPVGTTTTDVPLDRIHGTVLMGNAKNGTDVAFVEVDAQRQAHNIECPHGAAESDEMRAQQEARIDLFLSDENAPSLVVDYSSPSWSTAAFPLVLSLLPIWGLVFITNDARFEIDWEQRRARIVRTRRPFRAAHVMMDLDAIVAVRVKEIPNKKGPGSSWNVELQKNDATHERLAQAAGTSKTRAEEAASEIRKLLKRRDEERVG